MHQPQAAASNFAAAGLPLPWPMFANISAHTLAAHGCGYSKDIMQSQASSSYIQNRAACRAFSTCDTDAACLSVAQDSSRREREEHISLLRQADAALSLAEASALLEQLMQPYEPPPPSADKVRRDRRKDRGGGGGGGAGGAGGRGGGGRAQGRLWAPGKGGR